MYRDLPTNVLVERAKRNRFEQGIKRSGCSASIVVPLLLCGALWWYLPGDIVLRTLLCAGASPFVALWAYSSTEWLAGLRARHDIHELRRRFGRLPMRAYVRYFRQSQEPGTTTCLFHGSALPGFEDYWACLVFHQDGSARLESAAGHRLFDFGSGMAPAEAFRVHAGDAASQII